MMDKYKARGFIWVYKKILRDCAQLARSASAIIHVYEREIIKLKGNPSNTNRISVLQDAIESETAYRRKVYDMEREKARVLGGLIRTYDEYESTDHELAQLLNISHIAYEGFLQEHPEAKGSLHSSAFMHAETYREREVFFGEREARDSPLFEATFRDFIDMYDKNTEFREAVSKSFDETFGAIPRYQKVTYSDGTESFERMPPNLRVVGGEKEELTP
ncbi:hypothetical protein [Pontibacterium sp.]|uniref:hypothetical protein n=1 Tax=Pontibacterium sp. TaxID=2036026 RepID=UPI00356A4179